jgi:hypothetical protein
MVRMWGWALEGVEEIQKVDEAHKWTDRDSWRLLYKS